ncbi:hypothetical protein Ciccas_014595, partial [Cichlidogyrus casuarinus]
MLMVESDKGLNFLVDTGSFYSLITAQSVRGTDIVERGEFPQLFDVNGNRINVSGTITLPVGLGRTTIEHKFIIAEIAENILGLSFLASIDAKIDLKNKSMTGVYRGQEVNIKTRGVRTSGKRVARITEAERKIIERVFERFREIGKNFSANDDAKHRFEMAIRTNGDP